MKLRTLFANYHDGAFTSNVIVIAIREINFLFVFETRSFARDKRVHVVKCFLNRAYGSS